MGLLLWTAEAPLPYGLDVEVAAVWRALDERGWTEVHLVGFSAGATVVLAAALAQRDRVRTLVLIEPATVGDDLWSEETKRRSQPRWPTSGDCAGGRPARRVRAARVASG